MKKNEGPSEGKNRTMKLTIGQTSKLNRISTSKKFTVFSCYCISVCNGQEMEINSVSLADERQRNCKSAYAQWYYLPSKGMQCYHLQQCGWKGRSYVKQNKPATESQELLDLTQISILKLYHRDWELNASYQEPC